ncbi:hypothetical protein PLESTB_000212800 [Pleodorina starrii]|uniref:Uncharacterized protein n=1 Tax=Pleodorina starrii TaxID=330485 RepID=A0A9W6BC12_9CHLO|nr:hypothetical protein PLESTM_001538500 [Pleodorina starrii]GLC49376.1 hypothetical protein PLESTB_000212800 [Pleodorina starrii]GLC73362.1 hypothetical protein PLESTF_001367200 [Pleodorina starrii]
MNRVYTSAQVRAGQMKGLKNPHKMATGPVSLAQASGCLSAVLLLTTPSDARAAEFLATTTSDTGLTSKLLVPDEADGGSAAASLKAQEGSERFAAPRNLTCPDLLTQPILSMQSSSSSAEIELPVSEEELTPSQGEDVGAAPAASAPEPPAVAAAVIPSNPTAHACDIARLRGPLPYSAHISSRMTYTICGMRSSAGPSLPGRSA